MQIAIIILLVAILILLLFGKTIFYALFGALIVKILETFDWIGNNIWLVFVGIIVIMCLINQNYDNNKKKIKKEEEKNEEKQGDD